MAGLGVGGAAAAGLESGFNMGLRADEAQERRKQTGIENERRASLDADVRAERMRNNELQDDELALKSFTLGLEDERYALGALHAEYDDPSLVPGERVAPIKARIDDLRAKRQTILDKRSKPIIEKAQQEARDFSSRMAVGQADPLTLAPAKFNEYILASTGIPASRFINGEVGAAITDAQAGLETQNFDLVFKAANVLLPEIKQGIGQVAPDGSVIVDKELVGFAPAPMGPPTEGGMPPAMVANPIQGLTNALNNATMPSDSPAPAAAGNEPAPAGVQGPVGLQPGSDPDKLIPVLKVTTRQPDGRLTSYPAPITKDRSADPNAPVAAPVSMKALMDRLGQLTVLNTWMQKPEVKAKAEAGAAGAKKSAFAEAWGAVHGDPKALNDDNDPTSKKIKAIKKLAKDQGITFAEAARQFDGRGATGKAGSLQAKIDAIELDDDLTPAEKAKAKRVAYGLVGKAGAVKPVDPNEETLSPEAIDQTARTAINDRSALIGYGRNPKMLIKIANRMAELSEGGDVAGQRVLFGADRKSLEKMIPQYDAVVAFENNTIAQGKVLVDLAKKVDTTGIPVVERWIRAGRKVIAGDEDVSAFHAQLMLYGTEAAKILTNPNLTGVLTDSARHEVAEFLPLSATAKQIERVTTLLENDFMLRKKSIEDQTAEITRRMAERKAAPHRMGVGGGGTQVPAATQAARDSDSVAVLRKELDEEKQRLGQISDPAASARKQADIAAIEKELARKTGAKGTGLSGSPEKATTSFASEADAAAAAKAGKLKPGTRITINGVSGTWQ